MKDILSMYGSGTPKPQVPRANRGGEEYAKPIKYSPPKGPTEQMRDKPGLGGSVMPCGTQGKH